MIMYSTVHMLAKIKLKFYRNRKLDQFIQIHPLK